MKTFLGLSLVIFVASNVSAQICKNEQVRNLRENIPIEGTIAFDNTKPPEVANTTRGRLIFLTTAKDYKCTADVSELYKKLWDEHLEAFKKDLAVRDKGVLKKIEKEGLNYKQSQFLEDKVLKDPRLVADYKLSESEAKFSAIANLKLFSGGKVSIKFPSGEKEMECAHTYASTETVEDYFKERETWLKTTAVFLDKQGCIDLKHAEMEKTTPLVTCQPHKLSPAFVQSIKGVLKISDKNAVLIKSTETSGKVFENDKFRCFAIARAAEPVKERRFSNKEVPASNLVYEAATQYTGGYPHTPEISINLQNDEHFSKIQCDVKQIVKDARAYEREYPALTNKDFEEMTAGWLETNATKLYSADCGKVEEIGGNSYSGTKNGSGGSSGSEPSPAPAPAAGAKPAVNK